MHSLQKVLHDSLFLNPVIIFSKYNKKVIFIFQFCFIDDKKLQIKITKEWPLKLFLKDRKTLFGFR